MSIIHRELSGSFSGPQDTSKQLKDKDIKNKTNYNGVCSGFDVDIELEYNNKIIVQEFHYRRVLDVPKTWSVTTLLGDGGQLGDVPIRIVYETPTENFPLVKVAAMGLLYVRLTQMERMSYYEALNYELIERTDGL